MRQMRRTVIRSRAVLTISSGVIIVHTQRRGTPRTAGGDSRAFTVPFCHKCQTRSMLQGLSLPDYTRTGQAFLPYKAVSRPHAGSGDELRHEKGTSHEPLTARKVTVMLSTTFQRYRRNRFWMYRGKYRNGFRMS